MSIELLGPLTPPAEVVTRLKQIDPHLTLKFVEFAQDQEGNRPRWWALAWEWPKEDPRNVRVMRGEIGQASTFDVLGYIPLDCDVYDAFNYVKNHLLQRRQDSNVRRFIDRLDEYNRDQTKKNVAEVTERAGELFEAAGGKLFEKQGKTVPKVFQSGAKNASGASVAGNASAD